MEHEGNSVGRNDTEAGSAGDVGDKSTKSLVRYGKKTTGGEQNLGKEWIDMVEGIALFFDQALPVNLLFAQERGQYGSLRRQILAQRRNSAAARAASVTLKNDCGVAIGTIERKNEESEHSSSPPPDDRGTALSESSAEVPSSGGGKSSPHNFLPERMSEIYGCEHLLRLFPRLPGVVAESSTMTGMETRRIFSMLGDLVRYLQKGSRWRGR